MTEVPIEAVVRITQMQARYGHLVDARDWAGFRALFTDDAVFDVSVYGLGRLEGIEAIMTFFEAAPHPAAHHATNIEVWQDGGTLRSRSKYVVGTVDGAPSGGDYDDVLVETDRGWLFSERVVSRRWPGVPA
jgi:3-phenylpropionate/cinnamic acid dioxygenase small subunit